MGTLAVVELTVPRRYCGPPESGNGGWVSGSLAAHVRTSGPLPAVSVRLSAPPPLERPMPVVGDDPDPLTGTSVLRLLAGDDAATAATEAGYNRLRPVLMTALAMIIGMLPMAIGLGEGGEQNAPLGRAVIGGLLFATVATLFFVPTVFALIHGRRGRRHADALA